jgi:hypothetical protein
MEHEELDIPRRENGGAYEEPGPPSMTAALESLAAGSQGIITKRIDLALLEAHELFSRTLPRVALIGAGTSLAVAAWFAAAASVVEFVAVDSSLPIRLALFALLNGVSAAALIARANRQTALPAPKQRTKAVGGSTTGEV